MSYRKYLSGPQKGKQLKKEEAHKIGLLHKKGLCLSCCVTNTETLKLHENRFSRGIRIYYIFKVSVVSLSVCYVTILSLQGFHCFIVDLLRDCFVLGFDCLFLCFLRHYTISSMSPLFHYLFVTSPYYLFKVSYVSLPVCYVTITSLQGFHCFIICL